MASKHTANVTRARPRQRRPEEPTLLTAAELREIKRQIRDLEDLTRFRIRDNLLGNRRISLFYNVTEDAWTRSHNDATLFKRREAAQLIAGLLGSKTKIEKTRVARRKTHQ